MINEEAYVCIAYGRKYVEEAERLLKSIKKFDTKRKFVLISNEQNNLFDESINIDHEFINEKNSHNKFCVLARIFTPKYIKYERFMMIDTDILCLNDPEYVWDLYNNGNCFNCIGGRDGSKWHWGHINAINKKLNMNLKPMHGGVIYFNKKSPDFDKYFTDLLYALNNYDSLGFKRQFRNGAMTDEIVISYANTKNNISPFDFATHPVVSFTLSSKYSTDEKIVSWGTKDTTFKTTTPTIFNHFTGLNENDNCKKTYQEWLKKLNIK